MAASAASQKPAGWPRLNAGALSQGVMVFALLDDFMNLKNLHIHHEGKNSCHREAVGNMHIPPNVGGNAVSPLTNLLKKESTVIY